MFDYLVLAVIIEDTIFGVHGGLLLATLVCHLQLSACNHSILIVGLSPSIHTIDQIRIIDRFKGGCARLANMIESLPNFNS